MEEIRELLVNSKVSFSDLVNKSNIIQSKCSDFNITKACSHNVQFDPNTLKLYYKPDEDSIRTPEMTRYALSQLCNKIGVPIRYIEKCVDSGRLELATDNVNSWLDDYNKNLFIREHDNKIRGVLSDKYSVLDTPDILDSLLGYTVDENEYNVKGYYMSPERFHARLIQKERLDIEGEDLFAGLQVDSSDVGRSVVTVQFFIYKQVCTNGLCISKGGGMLFQQKHIGIAKDEFYSSLSESIKLIPDLITLTKNNIIEARKEDKDLKKAYLSEKEMEILKNSIKYQTRLSDEGTDKVIDFMKNHYTPSRWGLINSITEVAQEYSLERRLELEKLAGGLLVA